MVAVIFFAFLYQDTEKLNRMETHAEALLSKVPAGTRIIPMIFADPDSRIAFIVHLADRACVGRCFIYSNYEPSSKQFRVRVAKSGSWIVSDSAEDANDMQGGSYEIQQSDLPIKQLYQCDRAIGRSCASGTSRKGRAPASLRLEPDAENPAGPPAVS